VRGEEGESGVERGAGCGRPAGGRSGGVILRVVNNQRMDSESDEEFDEDRDVIEKPIEIIKAYEEYEVKNRLLGAKRDVILKLTTPKNGEDELKNLFAIVKEMSVIKDSKLFKMLRYFPPILEMKNGQPVHDDDDYESRVCFEGVHDTVYYRFQDV
jgi:hypothetical protein